MCFPIHYGPMKSLFLIFFFLTQASFALCAAEENVCQERVREHMELIASTNDYFKTLKATSSTISSYEITQLQKALTKRYTALKKLQSYYIGTFATCAPIAVSHAVSIYDFSSIRTLLIEDKDLRRVVKGFTHFDGFELTTFLKDYNKYNSNDVITKTLVDINMEETQLPAEVRDIHVYEKDYDPNMYALSDKAIQGTTSIVAGGARIWGFISDHMKWRQGRLNTNDEAKSFILSKLKPLDMLFEKRTFVLSNYTIPGHWGHVGVWLGTKEELIALGIWDQPFFAPFREKVEEGKNIVEIRKEGLSFQSIDTFLNLDEIGASRISGISERLESVMQELVSQSKKKYDFKFDSRTADKITCAEFISFSYGNILWHESKTLFQRSLRPDDLALLSVTNPEQSEFIFYLRGNKKSKDFFNLDASEWAKLFKIKKELPLAAPEEEKRVAQEN